jgi:hypothetical protein
VERKGLVSSNVGCAARCAEPHAISVVIQNLVEQGAERRVGIGEFFLERSQTRRGAERGSMPREHGDDGCGRSRRNPSTNFWITTPGTRART